VRQAFSMLTFIALVLILFFTTKNEKALNVDIYHWLLIKIYGKDDFEVRLSKVTSQSICEYEYHNQSQRVVHLVQNSSVDEDME